MQAGSGAMVAKEQDGQAMVGRENDKGADDKARHTVEQWRLAGKQALTSLVLGRFVAGALAWAFGGGVAWAFGGSPSSSGV